MGLILPKASNQEVSFYPVMNLSGETHVSKIVHGHIEPAELRLSYMLQTYICRSYYVGSTSNSQGISQVIYTKNVVSQVLL